MAGGTKSAGPLGQSKGQILKSTAWIEINLDNLEHNLKQVESRTSARVLPVLKSDAYGHGAGAVARFLREKGYPQFAVSSVDEALNILQCTDASLVLLTPPLFSQIPVLIKKGLIAAVTGEELIHGLAHWARLLNRTVLVQLKVDTGLGRLGVPPAQALGLAELIKKTPLLQLEGVFTHFSSAFKDHNLTEKQLQCLLSLRQAFEKKGWDPLTWHAAGSASFLSLPNSHLDLVRIGTLLYGQAPLTLDSSWELRPTWSLKTRLIQIRTLLPGESIGYAQGYQVRKRIRVGIIPVGYGQGLQVEPQTTLKRRIGQTLGNIIRPSPSPVRWGKKALPILGRIGMGLTCLDLSDAHGLQVGDELSIKMRRVTAARDLPRFYFEKGRLKYTFIRGRLI